MKKIYLIPLLLLLLANVINANERFPLEIPTRVDDPGLKFLSADLYSADTNEAKPVILIQTPYNKNLVAPVFLNPVFYRNTQLPVEYEHFNYVIMDWRGFFENRNQNISGYDRGLDGYDAIEWIADQSWCNGKIATQGASALGVIQFQTMRHQPPHHVCAIPVVRGLRMLYYQYYYGGVLRLEHTENLQTLGFGSGLVKEQPIYNNFWKAYENQNYYPDKISVPLLMIGGWFDHYPKQSIEDFEILREESDPSVRDKHKLLMGPWTHSNVGYEEQGILNFPDAVDIPNDLMRQFLGFYLLDEETAWESRPPIQYFQMGDNEWKFAETWKDVKSGELEFFLHPGSKLSADAFNGTDSASCSYDPKDPSPSIGGARLPLNDVEPGPQDMSLVVEQRNDILIMTSDELDKPVSFAGQPEVKLYVSSDREDTDFAVRICDVYPDGRSVLLRQGIHKLRFRNSLENPELLTPGEIVEIAIGFDDMAHTFLPGHKIRIDITSSNYPVFDINLNNGGPLNEPGDTLVAENKIYFGEEFPSRLILPAALPSDVFSDELKNEDKLKIITVDDNYVRFEFNNEVHIAAEVIINDLTGRKVSRRSVNLAPGLNRLESDISGLAPGIYFLILKTGRYAITGKFIK